MTQGYNGEAFQSPSILRVAAFSVYRSKEAAVERAGNHWPVPGSAASACGSVGQMLPSACSIGKGNGPACPHHAPKDVCAGGKCFQRGSKILPTQRAARLVLVDANVVSAKERKQQ